jgi:DNA-binding GntR family transcriptional regulator
MGAVSDPVYRRVLEDLRAQIRDGVLGPGARVPSRNGIIARYGVGETAAKHALQVLAAEGLIESRAGSGSFVRAMPAPCQLEHDRPPFPGSPFGLPDSRGAAAAGRQPAGASAVVSWEHQTGQVPAPRQAARRLKLALGEPVVRTRYLLTADGSPVQLAVSYEPAALTAGSAVVLPEEGPYAGRGVIERMRAIGVTVDQVIEDIAVRACVTGEALALGIPAGAPVFAVTREHRAGDRVVEVAEIVLAADRFRLRYRMPLTNGSPAAGGQPLVTPLSPAAPAGSRA